MRPFAATTIAVSFVLAGGLAARQELSPPLIGPALVIADYVAMPITGLADGEGNNAGSLARINFLREEPASSGRLFVNDLTGPLYILDKTTRRTTKYLDFDGRGARTGLFDKLKVDEGLASGFISFAFDPDYANNGRFYTIHLEVVAAEGSEIPANAGLPGLRVAGYTPTPAVDLPGGGGDHEGVLVEWTDSNIANTTFEGTARELLRIRLFSRIHPVGDLIFNPAARRGDPDWRVLYLACGDGGSGDQRSTPLRLNGQRLDTMAGKILRIVPDLTEHVATTTVSQNGRYRIPRDNPFVAVEDARKEIWAFGLRNPHRLSWDGNSLIASVIGWNTWENVVIIRKGANYGFPLREGGQMIQDGKLVGPPARDDDRLPIYVSDAVTGGDIAPTYPVLQYPHTPTGGDSIAGGFVYRGNAVRGLQGKFVFGDIASGRIWHADFSDMLAADDGDPRTMAAIHELPVVWDDPADAPDAGAQVYPTMFPIVKAGYHARGGKHPELPGTSILSRTGRVDLRFATDRAGELYLLSKSDGVIRIVTGVK